jgi:hypothetical protein
MEAPTLELKHARAKSVGRSEKSNKIQKPKEKPLDDPGRHFPVPYKSRPVGQTWVKQVGHFLFKGT